MTVIVVVLTVDRNLKVLDFFSVNAQLFTVNPSLILGGIVYTMFYIVGIFMTWIPKVAVDNEDVVMKLSAKVLSWTWISVGQKFFANIELDNQVRS
jgi:hypothetical protein